MKIVENNPPNIDLIQAVLKPTHDALYCYGDTIYNPGKRIVTKDLVAHEEVHSKQQGDHVDAWYAKYLTDPQFRLEQEIEAYGAQWLYIKENVKDAKLRDWLLENMADALSSESYGNLCTFGQAKSWIRNYV